MAKFVNRTGQRFGKLVVVVRAGVNKFKQVLWQCVCDCGKTTKVPSGALVTGNTTSCGCVIPNFKHGGWDKSSYNTWRAMMRRCYNEKDKDFKKYGAVGVTVQLSWHDYVGFAADMGEPKGTETLDRIDAYGNYTLSNCRWATLPTQARNTRIRATTKSGVTGVSNVYKDKWMAKITAAKRAYYSAVCNTVEEAAIARKELERLHWGVA